MKEKNKKLGDMIESILLVAEKPVSTKELATTCGVLVTEVQKSLAELIKHYLNRGIKIIKKGDYYSLVTAPEYAETVGRFLNEELRHDLTEAALETLSVVTYKQPITRIEVEEIRGVNSDQIIRNLMIRGLIAEIGRKESPGKPILYGTTMEFLQYFGLENESELPMIETETKTELLENVDTIK